MTESLILIVLRARINVILHLEKTYFSVYGNNIGQLHTKAFEVDDNLKEINLLQQKQCGHQNRDVTILVTVVKKTNKNMRKIIKEGTQF